jgi:hypothetical protein
VSRLEPPRPFYGVNELHGLALIETAARRTVHPEIREMTGVDAEAA